MPGAPVTLQLTDVPERQALDIVLRGAAGYMVLARDTATPGASAFDKILVLADNVTCSRGTRRPRNPRRPPPQFQNRPDTDVDLDEPAENPQDATVRAHSRERPRAPSRPNAPVRTRRRQRPTTMSAGTE